MSGKLRSTPRNEYAIHPDIQEVRNDAEADAMKAQAQALSANPVLVEMRKAEAWNGALPTSIYAGAPIPFMSAK